MKKHLKDYLVPHKENEYKPHALREAGFAAVALVAFALFAVSMLHTAFLLQRTDFVASVLPGVLVQLTNIDRTENGLFELTPSPLLEEAARRKAQHMAENGYFAHTSPEGVTPWVWFIEVGYPFVRAGENLAVNFVDSDDVEEAWMNSPTHRANILNADFTEIGIGTAEGIYKGKKTVFVVQLFGRPRGESTAHLTVPEAQEQIETVTLAVAEETEPVVEPVVTEESVEVLGAESEDEEAASSSEPVSVIEEVSEEPPVEAVRILQESDTFIVAEQTGAFEESPTASTAVAGTQAEALREGEIGLWQQLLLKPRSVITAIYLSLGILIVLLLLLMIVVEIKVQHVRNIAYGALIIVLIGALGYLSNVWINLEALIL